MRRSLLFVPGNNPAMLQNADVFGADGIILDLEDAVAVAEKDAARDLVKDYLSTWDFKDLEVMVRVNGIASGWLEADLEAVLSDRLSAVVFPKADVDSVYELDRLMAGIETSKRMTRTVAVIAIVESAIGVLETDDLAFMPRLAGILLGGEDLAAEIEIVRTKAGAELAYPRAKIAFACKAAGLDAIDTPFTDAVDADGFEADAATAKSLGFAGKALIHPNQIELANRVFAPSAAERLWARRVLAAAEDAKQKHLGVFALDGKMVDKPVILRATRIIERAVRCGLAREHDEE